MKITTFVLFLLMISTIRISAQSDLELSIENIQISSDSLFVQFSFINAGEKPVKIYKPEKQDICYGIVRILVRDSNSKKYQIMACDEIIDLDALVLSCKNSFYLAEDEKFMKTFKFSLKDAVPFLPTKIALYAVIEINLKDVSFEGDVSDLDKCDFKSKNETKFTL